MSAVSLLSVLKAPRSSELSRKRKVVVNPPPKGKRSARRSSKTTVNIKPYQRVKEFPGEHFTVSNGKLFCEACREVLNTKKSSVSNHIQSAKHKNEVLRLQQKEKRNQTLVQALQRYKESNHIRGETLPLEHQAYCVKVVRTFLAAAVPLNKLDKFRSLLEESAFSLSDRRHMSDHFVAAMHDRASVNDAAMNIVKVIYPNLLDVGCFSHTLDLVGEHFHMPTLSEFGVLWVSLFAHSPKVQMLWKDHTSLSSLSHSMVEQMGSIQAVNGTIW